MNQQVIEAIESERAYQDVKWMGDAHTVGEWLIIMEKCLLDAKRAWTGHMGDLVVLDEVRQVVAVGVACMEAHGARPRLFVEVSVCPEAVCDLIGLVMEIPEGCIDEVPNWIGGFSAEEQGAAVEWAACRHMAASDHMYVEVPETPRLVVALREWLEEWKVHHQGETHVEP